MHSFFVAVNAIAPILFHLAFGALARACGIASEELLQKLNKMIFRLCFPFLLFSSIYSADRSAIPSAGIFAFLLATVLIVAAVAWAIVPRLVAENARRGVIIMTVFRSNFVILGMAIGEQVIGPAAAAGLAMVVTSVVVLYNVLGVVVLEYYDPGRGRGVRAFLKGLVQNPLLQGAAVGMIFLALDIRLPASLERPVAAWASVTTPMALFILGGSMHISMVGGNAKYLVPTIAARLAIVPAFALASAALLGFRGAEMFCAFAVFATPAAAAIYPLAQNMGGDAELAGELVVLSTILSVFTMFCWIFLLSFFGLL